MSIEIHPSNLAQAQWNGVNSATTNTGGATVTWGSNALASSTYPGIAYPGTYTTNTTITYNPIQVTVDIKRCRNCNHAHLAEQTGCIDQEGWNTIFVICKCTEYLPKDNLEYLEYLAKKKESH
jgi:hypothetical protein